MENIIWITVKHSQQQDTLFNSKREAFWKPFQNTYIEYLKGFNQNRDLEITPPSIDALELKIKNEFGRNISNSLMNYCSKGLSIFERRYYREYNRRSYSEYVNLNDYEAILYKNEPHYREAVNKSLLSSQVIFKVS